MPRVPFRLPAALSGLLTFINAPSFRSSSVDEDDRTSAAEPIVRSVSVDPEQRTTPRRVMAEYTKDPSAVLDYDKDWEDWLDLVSGGDTISTSTWTALADNPDTDLTIDSTSKTDTTTKVWLSGGTVGVKYGITNRIVTAGGRTDERTDYWTIEER